MSNGESWRKFGGIRKQNKFHNLSIGTLVADNILLRESYSGEYTIQGTLVVKKDADVYGNVISKISVYTNNDLCIGKNAYVNKKLFFGQGDPLATTFELDRFDLNPDVLVPDSDTITTYLYGTSDGIAINSIQPNSVLDINGQAKQNVLTVRNNLPTIQNILSQNASNRGLVLNTTTGITSLSFYNSNAISSSVNPDLLLQNSNGTMNMNSTHSIITTTGNTNLINNNMSIVTGNILALTSGSSMNIETPTMQIKSRLKISNRNTPIHIVNETAIIYDVANGNYLYDAFESTTNNTGNALSLVASDNSSNTFMALISPNKMGMALGGGSYIKDTSRSLGTMGIIDSNGIYKPSYTVISGNTMTKYLTTMGINTHVPRSENYILDINGPTHISNGEINKLKEFNIEISKVSFPKTNKNFAIAVGSASTLTLFYAQIIFYSTNGGLTWSESRIFRNYTNLENNPVIMTVNVYNDRYAVVGTERNNYFYTKDGGITWIQLLFTDDRLTRNITNIYISDVPNSTNNNLKLITAVDKRVSSAELFYFTLDFSVIYTSTLPLPIREAGNSNDRLTIINDMDGFGSIFYLVGTGIKKYNYTNVSNTIDLNISVKINASYTYNAVYVYSETYVIAVGTNIISYTINGTDWINIPLVNVNLKSIHIYNNLLSVAGGDNGVFLYTINGGQSWQVIPNSILNAAGNANTINGTNNTLINVLIKDMNSIYVTSIKQRYTDGITTGLTKLYNCFIPNLFNRTNNVLLEISGNMVTSGDMNINDGGKLMTNNQNFLLLNENVQNMYFAGSSANVYIGNTLSLSTVYINNNLDISNNINIRKGMTTTGDIIGKSRLFIDMDASLNSNLFVLGSTTIAKDVSLNGNIVIHGVVKMNSNVEINASIDILSNALIRRNLLVNSDSSLNGNLTVFNRTTLHGDASFNGRLNVMNKAIMNNTLEVSNDASFNSNVFINKDLLINGNLRVKQYQTNLTISTINYQFIIAEDMSVNGRLYVSNDVSFSGNFYIENKSILNDDVSMNKRLFIQNDASFSGNVFIKNKSVLNDDVSVSKRLFVTNDASFSGNVYVNVNTVNNGPVTMNNTLFVSGKTTVNSDLSLNRRLFLQNDASFSGKLLVKDDVSLNTNLYVDNDTTINNRLFVNGQATLQNGLISIKDISANRNLSIGNNVSIGNKLDVTNGAIIKGNTLLNGNVTVNGLLDARFPENSIPFSALAGGLSFASGTFAAEVTGAGNLNIGKNAIIGSRGEYGNITAYGNVLISQGLTIEPFNNIGNITLTTIGGNLLVEKQSQFNSDATINANAIIKSLTVLEDTSLNQSVFIDGNTKINNNLVVNGNITTSNVTVDNNLVSLKNTLLNSTLFVIGDVSLNSRLFMAGDVSLNSNLVVGKNIVTNGSIIAVDDVSFHANLHVNRDISLNGTLNITTNDIKVKLSATNINVYDGISQYSDISLNKLIYIKNLNTDVNTTLADIQGRTRYLTGNVVDGNTKIKFDIPNNNIITYSNIIPVTANTVSVGSSSNYYNSVFMGEKALNFMATNGDQAVLSYEQDSSSIALTINNDINKGTFVQSYHGNVALNIKTSSPEYTLDVSGILNMRGTTLLKGDVSLNSNIFIARKIIGNSDLSLNGNIITNGNALFNGTVVTDGPFTANNKIVVKADASFNSRLFLDGDVSMNSNLFIKGLVIGMSDVSLNSRLFIGDNVSLNSDLSIKGRVSALSDLSMGGRLIVNSDASLNSNVSIRKTLNVVIDASINRRLFVNGDVSFNSNLTVQQSIIGNSDVSFNGRASISGDVSFNSDVTIKNSMNVLSNGFIEGTIKGNSKLLIQGDASFNANAFIYNNLTVNNNVAIVNDLSLSGRVNIDGESVLNRYTTIKSGLTLYNKLIGLSDISLNGRLFIDGDTRANGNLYAKTVPTDNSSNLVATTQFVKNAIIQSAAQTAQFSAAIISGNLRVLGDSELNRLYVPAYMNVAGSTDLNNLYVNGNTDISGNVILDKSCRINGTLQVVQLTEFNNLRIAGDLTSNRLFTNTAMSYFNRIYVAGLAEIDCDLSMSGNLYLKSDLSMNGNLYVKNNAIITNSLTVNNGLSVTGNTGLTGKISVSNDGTIGGRLFVANDVSFNGKLYVKSGLDVTNNTLMTGRLTVTNDVSLNNNLDITGKCKAASYSTASDYRIKSNVMELDDTFVIDQLKPIHYHNKITDNDDIGFMAHEVQEIYPYLVIGKKDDAAIQSVNYNGIIGILVKEIKDLKRENRRLRKDMEEIKEMMQNGTK
jgi:acyl-[acyl carrier protein]--UDP-N-acetylglucosamine O-acyltransferase